MVGSIQQCSQSYSQLEAGICQYWLGSVSWEISADHSPWYMTCTHQRFQHEQVESITATLCYCSPDLSLRKTYLGSFVVPQGVLIHVISGTGPVLLSAFATLVRKWNKLSSMWRVEFQRVAISFWRWCLLHHRSLVGWVRWSSCVILTATICCTHICNIAENQQNILTHIFITRPKSYPVMHCTCL